MTENDLPVDGDQDPLATSPSQPKADDSLPALSSDHDIFKTIESRDTGGVTSSEPSVDDQVGPYRLVSKIAEGGMGAVFRAEQLEPIKRTVALKLIKSGRDSEQIITRFEAERQALAMMDHPNIAKILDAGTTANGAPYFVMELVEGIPLTQYCDENKLSIEDRLELFIPVCQAIQHAHQKGIIHRDLKPSNVLVGSYDGKGIPKVIDFGLAKATQHTNQLTDKTMFTEFGQVVGTLQYMSPEQAETNHLDIDTRTDIYSLGVMLYELLTGSTPLDRESMQQKALLKILEMIQNDEPPRPSTRLSSSGESIKSVSAERQIQPAKLQQILAGELDWVVMKALEKERERRYETAAALAKDIQHYLDDEPVIAKPPSRTYQIQKFVRKNRGLVASLATIGAVLIAGILGTTWFAMASNSNAIRASQNAEKANKSTELERLAKDEAIKQKEAADESAQNAMESEKRMKEVLDIVTTSFRSISPKEEGDMNMLASDVLDNARFSMNSSNLDDRGKSQLMNSLNAAFLGIGAYPQALDMAEQMLEVRQKFLPAGHKGIEFARYLKANSLSHVGRFNEAIPILEEVVEKGKSRDGLSHPDTLRSIGGLASALTKADRLKDAVQVLEEAFQVIQENDGIDQTDFRVYGIAASLGSAYLRTAQSQEALDAFQWHFDKVTQVHPENHPKVLNSKQNLAIAFERLGQMDKAFEIYKATLASAKATLGGRHPWTLSMTNNLAVAHEYAGNYSEAQKMFEYVLETRTTKRGEEHPLTIAAIYNLARVHNGQKHLKLAADLATKSLELYEKVLGKDHQETLKAAAMVATCLAEEGKFSEAIPKLVELLKVTKAKFGSEHSRTFTARRSLATALHSQGRFQQAAKLHQGVYEFRIKELGPNHFRTLEAASALGVSLQAAGKVKEALPVLELALKGWTQLRGTDHPTTLNSAHNVAAAYFATAKYERALKMFEEVATRSERVLGGENPKTMGFRNGYAVALAQTGKYEQAVPLLEKVLAYQDKKLGPDNQETLSTRGNLAAIYFYLNRLEKAIVETEKTLAAYKAQLGPEHPGTLSTMKNLATMYGLANKRDKAEVLLTATLELLRKTQGEKHPDTIGCLSNLGSIYAESEKWEKSREAYLEALEANESVHDDSHDTTLRILAGLANAHSQLGEWEKAEEQLKKVLILDNGEEVSHVVGLQIQNAKSLMSLVLAERGDLDRAEEMGTSSFSLVDEYLGNQPELVKVMVKKRMIKRLIRVYELAKKSDKQSWWQSQLEELDEQQ